MNRTRLFKPEWWVVTALVGVLVGWWLAMRSLALKATGSRAVAVEEPKPALPEAVRLPLSERSEDYLTIDELVAYLPVGDKTIRREIKARHLPSTRIRGKVTVKGSDALAWLSARREA